MLPSSHASETIAMPCLMASVTLLVQVVTSCAVVTRYCVFPEHDFAKTPPAPIIFASTSFRVIESFPETHIRFCESVIFSSFLLALASANLSSVFLLISPHLSACAASASADFPSIHAEVLETLHPYIFQCMHTVSCPFHAGLALYACHHHS